jgi:hypothetical protein
MVREVIGNFCLSDCLRLGRTWIEANLSEFEKQAMDAQKEKRAKQKLLLRKDEG